MCIFVSPVTFWRFIGFWLFLFCLLYCCEILYCHWSGRDACPPCVVLPSILLHMYCLPEHLAVSIYPEDGGSIHPNRLRFVTTQKQQSHLWQFSLLITLAPPSSPVLYTFQSSSPFREVLAYWYSNWYMLLTYTLAFISHAPSLFVFFYLQYGPLFLETKYFFFRSMSSSAVFVIKFMISSCHCFLWLS